MSEVMRYESDAQYCAGPAMVESAEGGFVDYEDYAALKAERDALAAENAALKVLADACSREYESPKTEACDDDEKVAYPEEQCNITFGMIRSAARTPATDAYLNSVRAEGVEMFGSALKDKYEGIAYELIGNYETNGEEDRISDEGEIQEVFHFAAQLRTGAPS